MKIYVGCAIGNLPQNEWHDLFAKIEKLRQTLRGSGHEILNFRSTDGARDHDPKDVFAWDHAQCIACDAMIGIALHPSTGMGMETILCLTKPNPAFVFVTATKEANASKMLIGCNLPNYKFQYYEKFEDIPRMFEEAYKARNSI